MQLNLQSLLVKHQQLFGQVATVKVKAPARINIIGEHIDYLGGLVVPANVNLYMYGIFSKANEIAMYSDNFQDLGVIKAPILKHYTFDKRNEFMNYVLGCVEILHKHNYKIDGFHLTICSMIPCASGLSSSAAFGIMVMTGLLELYGYKMDNVQKAILFKEVENTFMHLHNGIMDQFIIANGKANHLMCLNTATLVFDHIPVNLGQYEFVIFNTKKPRTLITSKYNERVAETSLGLKEINRHFNFRQVCDIPYIQKLDVLKCISNPVVAKRISYAIDEQQRVQAMLQAIKNNDYKHMGEILNAGHAGLRDLYEVSCAESDFIQAKLITIKGVLGARMTGAGFGGCLIALVDKSIINQLVELVIKPYNEKFHHDGEMYLIEVVDGVQITN